MACPPHPVGFHHTYLILYFRSTPPHPPGFITPNSIILYYRSTPTHQISSHQTHPQEYWPSPPTPNAPGFITLTSLTFTSSVLATQSRRVLLVTAHCLWRILRAFVKPPSQSASKSTVRRRLWDSQGHWLHNYQYSSTVLRLPEPC